MKFLVTAITVSRRTRRRIGKAKVEVVDPALDPTYERIADLAPSQRPAAVERAYEDYWNNINPNSPDTVKVIDVREVQ